MVQKVLLVSNSNEVLEIKKSAALKSKYLQGVIPSLQNEDKIPINANTLALKRAISFLEHHEEKEMGDIPKPLKDYQKFSNNISDSWDSELVDGLSREECFSLIKAAQELQVPALISLVASYCAFLINGKSVEKIREFFQVDNDLTSDEQKDIQRENACLNK